MEGYLECSIKMLFFVCLLVCLLELPAMEGICWNNENNAPDPSNSIHIIKKLGRPIIENILPFYRWDGISLCSGNILTFIEVCCCNYCKYTKYLGLKWIKAMGVTPSHIYCAQSNSSSCICIFHEQYEMKILFWN